MKRADSGNSIFSKGFFSPGAVLKYILAAAILFSAFGWAQAQDLKGIKLVSPDKEGGLPIMKALALRQSAKDADKWSDKEISPQDLSNLLWAANGINREDSKKRTAASAQNGQDVDIYVFNKEGVYIYNAGTHSLDPVAAGDHRSEIGMMPGGGGPRAGGPPGGAPGGAQATAPAGGQGGPPAGAGGPGPSARPTIDYPLELLIVSENARFGFGPDEKKYEWGCLDAGMVAQNIMLYCSGNGLITHPKAGISEEKMKSLLNLTDTQHVLLELPIGYPK